MNYKAVAGVAVVVSVLIAGYAYRTYDGQESSGQSSEKSADSAVVEIADTEHSASRTNVDAAPASTSVAEGGQVDIFSPSATGKRLAAFLGSLEDVGPGVGLQYERNLSAVRADPNSISELMAAYRRLEPQAYDTQYKILFVLDQLKAQQALSLATEVATSELPQRSSVIGADDHGMTEYQSAVFVHMRAVGVLSSLAKDGQPQAQSSLMRVISETPDPTVRRQAVISYLNASTDLERDTAYVKAVLPPDQQYLATTQTNIEKMITPSAMETFRE